MITLIYSSFKNFVKSSKFSILINLKLIQILIPWFINLYHYHFQNI